MSITHTMAKLTMISFMEDNSGISGLLEESLVVEAQDLDLVIPVEMS